METLFSAHLLELRFRFLYTFLSFVFAFVVASIYSAPLTHLICIPFSTNLEIPNFFIFTHPTEGLYAAISACVVCAFWFCVPFFMYQIYSFFIPSFYTREKKEINGILLCVAIIFLISVCIAFWVVLPTICGFLQQFQYSSKCMEIKLQARIASAVSWASTLFAFTILFFQSPILFILLSRAGLPIYFLWNNRKYTYFFILLTSSFISPPDATSQFLVASILCFFYEFLVWCALFYHKWIKK